MSSNKIQQVNNVFKQFVSQYFSDEIMASISKCNELYEESKNIEINEKEKTTKKKFLNCLHYMICWRENRQNQKVFSEQEKKSIIKSE